MKYTFSHIDLCGKAPFMYLKTFLLILNGKIVAHYSCVFSFSMSGTKYLSSSISHSDLTWFVGWRFVHSRFRFCKAVAMLVGRCFNNCCLLRPGPVSKSPLFITFRKVLGIGMYQHPCRYWIKSVLVLYHAMITWAQCLNVIVMGMSHNISVLFLCPFDIRW